jgi:hypothetical protein
MGVLSLEGIWRFVSFPWSEIVNYVWSFLCSLVEHYIILSEPLFCFERWIRIGGPEATKRRAETNPSSSKRTLNSNSTRKSTFEKSDLENIKFFTDYKSVHCTDFLLDIDSGDGNRINQYEPHLEAHTILYMRYIVIWICNYITIDILKGRGTE